MGKTSFYLKLEVHNHSIDKIKKSIAFILEEFPPTCVIRLNSILCTITVLFSFHRLFKVVRDGDILVN